MGYEQTWQYNDNKGLLECYYTSDPPSEARSIKSSPLNHQEHRVIQSKLTRQGWRLNNHLEDLRTDHSNLPEQDPVTIIDPDVQRKVSRMKMEWSWIALCPDIIHTYWLKKLTALHEHLVNPKAGQFWSWRICRKVQYPPTTSHNLP